MEDSFPTDGGGGGGVVRGCCERWGAAGEASLAGPRPGGESFKGSFERG